MQLRRSLALTTVAVSLSAALSSCGFDYATDRDYTPGVGTNNREGVVDVLSAVVVSTEPGSGTFIASLSNGSTTDDDVFSELTSAAGNELTVEEFEPVEVARAQLVNLADPPAEIKVSGDFEAGGWVTLNLGFESGQQTAMEVPVVPNSGYYEGLDGEPLPEEETAEETEGAAH